MPTTKELNKKTEEQQKYLKYYKEMRAAKKVPMTLAQWQKAKGTKGSSQTKKQMSGLSEGDYNEISKFFKK